MIKYKKIFLIIVVVFIFGASSDFEIPNVKTITLKNDLKIFYIKDNLPQITLTAVLGFGKLHETSKTAGLSDVIAQMLQSGGTIKYPNNALYQTIEQIGGKLRISAGYESLVVQIKVLARFKKLAFSILHEIITNPLFNKNSILHAKLLISARIKRIKDNPASIAFIKARKIIFNGAGYGAEATIKNVKGFTLHQIKSLWEKIAVSKNIFLGISTSISFEEIKNQCNKFINITAGKRLQYFSDKLKIKQNLQTTKGKIYFYKKDIPQATIVMGTLAPAIKSQNVYSLDLMNYVFGGGSFNSWLMKEIRVKRGLAYSTGSVVRSRLHTGVFLSYAQTRAKSAALVVKIMKQNIQKMKSSGVSPEELKWAKNSAINSYVFNFDSPGALLSNIIDLKYYNLPDNYYNNYLTKIKKTTRNNILRASKDLFGNPVVTILVGPEICKKQLEKKYKIITLK